MKISVIVTTFNHEKYIAQCIDSILMQQGDFDLEVVIGDDCSTDRTPEIVLGFRERHPNTIKPFLNAMNLGLPANLKNCFSVCTGDYIAICEGDDYWISPKKLSKQANFLKNNPECSMCFHGVMLLYEGNNEIVKHFAHERLQKPIITAEDLILMNHIGNFSCCMYRSDIIKQLPANLFDQKMADWLFNIACAQLGPICFLAEYLSVYRIHSMGSWSGKSRIKQIRSVIRLTRVYDNYLHFQYQKAFKKKRNSLRKELCDYIRSLSITYSKKTITNLVRKYPSLYSFLKTVIRRRS